MPLNRKEEIQKARNLAVEKLLHAGHMRQKLISFNTKHEDVHNFIAGLD